jgi:8-oxo-dGTP pyrophosphatase MutT (NUDIX family)
MPDAILRPAARVLVFDPDDRLLLIRVQNVTKTPLWITPGGGIDAGEDSRAAATRELWEETGIRADVGPCVWTRRHIFEFQGQWLDLRERFYIVRLSEAPDVSRDNWLDYEHEFLAEHRWWSVDEIAVSEDYFAPRRMAELLPPLIAGAYPVEPIDCGV